MICTKKDDDRPKSHNSFFFPHSDFVKLPFSKDVRASLYYLHFRNVKGINMIHKASKFTS